MASLYQALVAEKVLDLNQNTLDSVRGKIKDELKKVDEKKKLGKSEVRETHLAKSLVYIKIDEKEKALEQLRVTESKTVAVGLKMDLVFYALQIGVFHVDYLICKSKEVV